MIVLREYDTVRVIAVSTQREDFFGAEEYKRPPRVGDTAVIVHEYEPGNPNGRVAVENVDENGYMIWLADFSKDELELVSRPG